MYQNNENLENKKSKIVPLSVQIAINEHLGYNELNKHLVFFKLIFRKLFYFVILYLNKMKY